MFRFLKKFKLDERGAAAVEYGLLVAGIAVVVMAVIYCIGTALDVPPDEAKKERIYSVKELSSRGIKVGERVVVKGYLRIHPVTVFHQGDIGNPNSPFFPEYRPFYNIYESPKGDSVSNPVVRLKLPLEVEISKNNLIAVWGIGAESKGVDRVYLEVHKVRIY